MSGDVAQDARATTATQAAEELIANAVRHGGATEVNIKLELVATGIRLTGRINCTWAETDRAGLGTVWFATLSPKGVHTEQISGWTELSLIIE
jgi:hypothetical protein